MNEIYFLAVVIATATVVGAYYPGDKPLLPVPTKCPKTNAGVAVHIAHESDCTKFYKCDHGNKVPFDCPYSTQIDDYLHFNEELQVCDWPWSAGCEEKESIKTTKKPTTTSTTTTTKKPTTTSTTTTTTTKKPTTTSTTTTTTTQKPTTTSTTTTTKKPTTTSTTTTTTTQKPTTTSTTTTTTQKPSSTPKVPEVHEECPIGKREEVIRIPDKTDCRSYYVCHENGTAHKETCDEDSFFDPISRMCDWDLDEICPKLTKTTTTTTKKPTTTSTTTTTTTPKPQPKPKCPEVDDPKNPVIYPHECQCDIYYLCKDGEQIKKHCPKGKGFDINKKRCVPGEEVCVNFKPNENQTPNNQQPSNNDIKPNTTTDSSLFLKLFHWD